MPTTDGAENRPGWTTVSVRPETLRRIKQAKRGGESYDELLHKMVAQYQPVVSVPSGGEGQN